MPENKVAIQDANGNMLALDSTGRITANSVGQISADMYTEATTSRLVSGNTTAQQWLLNAQQCWVTVNLTALSGGSSPTVVVNLQQIDGNGNWYTLASTSALNAVSTAQFSAGTGMTTGAMLRAGGQYRFSWVITGTPATCSFQLSLAGR
jgi:hypothetical protein